MKKIIPLMALLLVLPELAKAATINAASCSQADVQAAIDSAQDGDIVLVPEGNCTWSAPVSMGKIVSWNPMTYESENITLQGEGTDRTIITSNITPSKDTLSVIVQPGKTFRITTLTFKGGNNSGRCQRAISVGGVAKGWRIDHVKIDYRDDQGASRGCGIGASGEGVIDHNLFLNVYTAVAVFGDGNGSWQRPLALGSSQMVYIEDNVMDNTKIVGDGATDAYSGARYVFRHNQVINARAGHHGLDSGGYRSPHSFEIYENTFNWTVSNGWYTWRSRGGTGVIFNNTITGDTSQTVTFGVVNYRTCCCTPTEYNSSGCNCTIPPCHNNCGTWGRCDGDNPIDGNLDPTGYPCMDQTGRSTDMNNDSIQDMEPLYEWNNTVNGKDANITVNDPWGCSNPSMYDHIKENRDFYNNMERPGYTPYTYPHPLTLMDQSCIHKSDLPPCDGCVDSAELMSFIDRWKVSNVDVTLKELIESIGFWKRGC